MNTHGTGEIQRAVTKNNGRRQGSTKLLCEDLTDEGLVVDIAVTGRVLESSKNVPIGLTFPLEHLSKARLLHHH